MGRPTMERVPGDGEGERMGGLLFAGAGSSIKKWRRRQRVVREEGDWLRRLGGLGDGRWWWF